MLLRAMGVHAVQGSMFKVQTNFDDRLSFSMETLCIVELEGMNWPLRTAAPLEF
jgi:hypothetical protein